MEEKFWDVADENITFTSVLINRLRTREWYHPFFKKTLNWEWMQTDEDSHGNEVVCGYILDKGRQEMSIDEFIKIVEANKETLWDDWARVIMDD